MLARAELHATVGEWVQGWIGGRECLVSLAVGWRGSVTLSLGPDSGRAGHKALRAFELAKSRFCKKDMTSCCIKVFNPHPIARGFATSTMDIAGVLAACAAYTGESLSDEELFSLCAGIEPSDGIMFEGLALVDHLTGELLERLPQPPRMEIVVLIPEVTLDTMDYRRDDLLGAKVRQFSKESENAYSMLKAGLSKSDARVIADAATLSATLQQGVVPKDEWGVLLRAKEMFGALGVAAAHSGTASALLFAPADNVSASAASAWLKEELAPCRVKVRRASASGGGVSVSMGRDYNK